MPRAVKLMLEKFYMSLPPHKRKKVEFACVIHATTPDRIAVELEQLADNIREYGCGYKSHGAGYFMSVASASCS